MKKRIAILIVILLVVFVNVSFAQETSNNGFNYGKGISVSPNFGTINNTWFVGLHSDIRLFKILNARVSGKLVSFSEVDKYVFWPSVGLFVKGALISKCVRSYLGVSFGMFIPDKTWYDKSAFFSFTTTVGIEAELIITGSGLMFVFVEAGFATGKNISSNGLDNIKVGRNVFMSAGLSFHF